MRGALIRAPSCLLLLCIFLLWSSAVQAIKGDVAVAAPGRAVRAAVGIIPAVSARQQPAALMFLC
jgi:hypothetical protein